MSEPEIEKIESEFADRLLSVYLGGIKSVSLSLAVRLEDGTPVYRDAYISNEKKYYSSPPMPLEPKTKCQESDMSEDKIEFEALKLMSLLDGKTDQEIRDISYKVVNITVHKSYEELKNKRSIDIHG